jgi:hypothetical protein
VTSPSGDIARPAYVTPPAIQLAFRKHLGTTPPPASAESDSTAPTTSAGPQTTAVGRRTLTLPAPQGRRHREVTSRRVDREHGGRPTFLDRRANGLSVGQSHTLTGRLAADVVEIARGITDLWIR